MPPEKSQESKTATVIGIDRPKSLWTARYENLVDKAKDLSLAIHQYRLEEFDNLENGQLELIIAIEESVNTVLENLKKIKKNRSAQNAATLSAT